jgi:Tripartite tricarboxylate transporter TctB family
VRRTSLVCGEFLLVLGALALIEALRLRDDWMGARLMPPLVGATLALLGMAYLRLRPTTAAAWPDAAGLRRVTGMVGLLVLYVALMPTLGFLLATALFARPGVAARVQYGLVLPITFIWCCPSPL